MHRNLFAQFTKPLVDIFFFFIKRALSFAVRISFAFESYSNRRYSGNEDPYQEPNHVWSLLHFFLSKSDREIVIGDLSQDHRKICAKSGKGRADKWLFEEMVESLHRLIFRRATLDHAWASIRQIFRIHILTSKLKIIKRRSTDYFVIYGKNVHWQKLSINIVLITLIFAPVWIGLQESSKQSVVTDGALHSSQREEILLNSPSKLKAHKPPPVSLLSVTRPVSSSNKKIKNIKSSETVSITLPVGSVLRGTEQTGGGKGKDTKVPNTRIIFSLTLPHDSDEGEYVVSLVNAFWVPLVTKRARSYNGKFISILFDLHRFPASKYYISVSRGGVDFSYYPIVIIQGNSVHSSYKCNE